MPRRILQGVVVSDKCDKTVTIAVHRRFMHPKYKKFITKTKKFTAHDPDNTFKEGDQIRVIETKPISKNKRWLVLTDKQPAA